MQLENAKMPASAQNQTPMSQELLTQEIHAITRVTDSIIQELWEASRDNDPTASFALTIEAPWIDPVEKLKKERLSFAIRDKSIVLKGADAPIKQVQAKEREFPRIAALQKNHEYFVKKSKDQDYLENLIKSDDYYADLQNFRKMYWDELVVDDEVVLKKSSVDLERIKKRTDYGLQKDSSIPEKGYVTNGFYRIDDRLFPTKINQKNVMSFGTEGIDIPPVKVSIPYSQLAKTCKSYKPLNRLDYDPKDSVNIADYLFKGNVPHLGQRRKKAFKPLASLKETSRS
jgi:hypothetical protein